MTGVYSVQIVFNVHNQVKLKILTVNPYIKIRKPGPQPDLLPVFYYNYGSM